MRTCDLFCRADLTYFHLFRPIRRADLTYFHLFRPILFHNKAPWTGHLTIAIATQRNHCPAPFDSTSRGSTMLLLHLEPPTIAGTTEMPLQKTCFGRITFIKYTRQSLDSKILSMFSCKRGHTGCSTIAKKIFWWSYVCKKYKDYYKKRSFEGILLQNFCQDGTLLSSCHSRYACSTSALRIGS